MSYAGQGVATLPMETVMRVALTPIRQRVVRYRSGLSDWWYAAKVAMTPGEEEWSYQFDDDDVLYAAMLIERVDKTPRTA